MMLTHNSRWSHARGNEVVPSRWQATLSWSRGSTLEFLQVLCHDEIGRRETTAIPSSSPTPPPADGSARSNATKPPATASNSSYETMATSPPRATAC